MASKTRTGLMESTPTKSSPATPRVSKLSRSYSKSDSNSSSPSLPSTRLSLDRSQNSVISKPSIDRRSPKPTTSAEKTPIRTVKSSEIQAQLISIQEDLKKSNEQIGLLEKEKSKVLEELSQARKAVEETNSKLEEALVAQKLTQEDYELEKFRVLELEQVKIEAVNVKEEECKKEIESVRNQHAMDKTQLFSITEELQKIKQDLVMVTNAKKQALIDADNATRTGEIHAEKAEKLSAELADLDAKIEAETSEKNKTMKELRDEIDLLNQQLAKAKEFEGKLMEKDVFVEKISVELEAAKMAESYACKLAEEWKKKMEQLGTELKESRKMEKSASESKSLIMKQIEESNKLLSESENKIVPLKEKVGLLEMTIGRQKVDLEESEQKINAIKGENFSMEKEIKSLKTELDCVKEERTQLLENEKLAALSVQSLLEEKNKLINDIEIAKAEEEKSKKAMEDLASALHEVSGEARETKERYLSIQVEHESNENQIEDLKLVLKTTNQKYESMLDEAKNEMDSQKNELLKVKEEWGGKEKGLVDSLKNSEEHNVCLEKEIDRLVNLLKETEEESCLIREEKEELELSIKGMKEELVIAKEEKGKVEAENLKLKDNILDKETELQNLFQENEDVRGKEAAALYKVEELSKLLNEAMAKPEENGEFSDSEKDYALLPKVVEFSEENGHSKEDEPSGVPNGTTSKNMEDEKDSVDGDFKMWESCQIEKKEYLADQKMEHDESIEEDGNVVAEIGESYDQINGLVENVDEGSSSPSKQQNQKKKKPLLRKFGSLLKKKASNTPK